ncbi:sulfurtransferase [Effusibacillus lacus]|uniref:Sulfurtransferase n=1 Tax=Effusibacillus lacus TaxID=1348429 RepID=A0A292YM71_9BACL|nr:sulfurtransferase [Effusibacillus lacus]TCS66827.1 thiosulfate/3-mercaptopyruvate sulfurtransferase [Effusibacillus lacus]GAX90276.1 sulfurtransferase [Effusibacillus lacus]
MAKNIVSPEWVYEHLQNLKVRIVDCRFVLGQPTAGREAYLVDHIPGAFHMDLEKDMSGPKQQHGGRHPLPDVGEFSRKLGEIGVDESVTVMAYDDQGGAMASRFWWMLKYLGHSNVFVMDGGYSHWKEKGFPVTSEVPSATATAAGSRIFTPRVQEHMLVTKNDVKARLGKEGTILIDSREGMRFKGIEEPIDPVAGHIPGALNYFWKDGLNQQGSWKSPEELKQRFSEVDPSQEVVVYCGSGVTACPNFLALKEAGYNNVKLYAGSWSDWISYPDNPIATEKDQ